MLSQPTSPNQMGTIAFSLHVGRLIVRDVEMFLRETVHGSPLTIEIEKHKGWIETTLLITVKGPASHLVPFQNLVREWLTEHKNDDYPLPFR